MSKSSIAQAYVQILPTTDDLQMNLTKSMSPQLEAAGVSGGKTLGGALTKTLAALGIGKAIKDSLNLGGALEQSLGGVDTLFKESADKVKAYANEAFSTAGVSANKYMEIVTGFSASLLQGLGGDTGKAADIADTALKDMADNVNKFGNNMDTVQAAYQGFARQTYTMLDSLKLGYGGSASEMARLVNESGVLGDAVKVTAETVKDVPFDQIIAAIHQVQENLGVTGATAEEAATTLQGSFAAMKAAAENTIGKLALGENVKPSLEALISTAKTYLFDNLLPMVGNIARGIPTVLTTAIKEGIPAFLDAGKSMISQLKTGFVENIPQLIKEGLPMLLKFAGEIRKNAGELVNMGVDMILSLVDGLVEGLPDLIKYVPLIISDIAGIINDNMPKILEAGLKIIIALGEGIIKNIPVIIANAGNIVKAILDVIQAINWLNVGKGVIEAIAKGVKALFNSIPQLFREIGQWSINSFRGIDWIAVGKTVIQSIGSGIKSLITHIPEMLKNIAKSAWDGFLNMPWANLGKGIIDGIAAGVSGAAASIASAAKSAASNALASAKKLLGIHSPSKVFRDEVGKMIGLGMAEGIGDSTRPISEALDDVTSKMSAGLDPITVRGSFDAGSMAQGGSMEQLLALVAGLSAKIDRLEIRLDGDKLVGGISEKMNKALGDQSALEARGVA